MQRYVSYICDGKDVQVNFSCSYRRAPNAIDISYIVHIKTILVKIPHGRANSLEILSFSLIGCLMSHATIFQLFMWRHKD